MTANISGVAFITGAGSGMGQLYARQLLDAGWAVAAIDINQSGLDALGDSPGLPDRSFPP